jgi:hypothetical protein
MKVDAIDDGRLGHIFAATPARIAPAQKGGKRKFSGIAYSGDPIRHPYLGQVVFDLSTTTAHDPTPILLNHRDAQRVGFARLSFSDQGIAIEDGELLSNSDAQAVAADSDDGFPWQMSVYIEPGSVEAIEAGVTASVNGREVVGPANIWRNNFIREVSWTPTGVDYNTSAQALSAHGRSLPEGNPAKEDDDMKLEELQAKYEALEAKFSAIEAERDAEKQRADEAEKAIREALTAARLSAVKDLFAATGDEFTEDAAAPFMSMDDSTFSAVSERMKGMAEKLGASGGNSDILFQDQADQGRQAPKDDETLQPMALSALYQQFNKPAA